MVKGGVVGVLVLALGGFACGGGNNTQGTGGGGGLGGSGAQGGNSGSYGWVSHDDGPFYTVNAIWGDRKDSLWAVTSGGQLLFYDGATWQFVFGGAMPPLYTVWGLPGQSDIYFAGLGRQFYLLRGPDVFDLSLNAADDNYAVWALRPDQVWLGFDVSIGGLARYDLTGATPSSDIQGPSDLAGVRAIWGPAADEVWVIDSAGELIHWVNQTWTRVTTAIPDPRLTAIHGTARNDVWAVGPYTLLHWDGSYWSEVDQGVNAGFVAVWAAGPSNAWVVSDVGWIAHVTPTSLQGTPSGTSAPLNAVWGTSPTDIWVGGENGLLLHYEPTTGGGPAPPCKARDDECSAGECCSPYSCRRILDVGVCGY